MTVRKVEIERFSVTSFKPFEVVVTALEAAIEHPNMIEFVKQQTQTFAGPESVVNRWLGRTGLMMFMKLDQGVILYRRLGLTRRKLFVLRLAMHLS
jgi:hypothetical protein